MSSTYRLWRFVGGLLPLPRRRFSAAACVAAFADGDEAAAECAVDEIRAAETPGDGDEGEGDEEEGEKEGVAG